MEQDVQKQVYEVLTDVRIPLENIEYAVCEYLRRNSNRLDPQTRSLLMGICDCVGRVANSTKAIVDPHVVQNDSAYCPTRQAEDRSAA